MRPLEFWFEFASTYSYLAASRIEALATEAGVHVVYRPFLLGPIFQRHGWNDSPFNLYPDKGRYMWRDLERICAARGLPLRRPSAFPRGSLLAARICVWGADQPWLPAFVRDVYSANMAEDREIGQREVIAELLFSVGVNAKAALAGAASDEVKTQLRANTEAAQEAGIFGAPTFRAGKEIFWGDDRLEQALAWAAHPPPKS